MSDEKRPPDYLAPGEKPLFLTPEKVDPNKYPGIGPDDKPNFDKELPDPIDPTDPIGNSNISLGVQGRYRQIARLHALGMTNNQIAERLGYTASRMSILLAYPEVQAEVARYRNQLYDQDLTEAMKDLGPDALAVIGKMINSPNEKLKDRSLDAKWLLEKLTGKARQEVDLESSSLAAFMEVLKSMKRSGETLEQPIDVTPKQVTGGEASANQSGEPVNESAPKSYKDPSIAKWFEEN